MTTPPPPRPGDPPTQSDPSPTDRQAAIRARCALGITHAGFWRALAHADDSDDMHEHQRTFNEAHRLLHRAISLDQQAKALDPRQNRRQ
jgi:hypothetical protein